MAGELTIRLDEDVAELLEKSRRTGKSVDDAVNEAANDAVRKVLQELAPVVRKPFVIHPRNMGPLLIDIECTSRALAMLDESEATNEQ
jgi:hypothetical protein